eukprot:TRINITY_DN2925_c0_g1_i3.p1 TRINITY_DN2925_c0_g1~~TRINITY_DN2925_c0_g1_i3.p1  ORF type:complete len:307 (+),score=-5.50 TRINITY_DN2925_c0_g1_i3:424-1344(+)
MQILSLCRFSFVQVCRLTQFRISKTTPFQDALKNKSFGSGNFIDKLIYIWQIISRLAMYQYIQYVHLQHINKYTIYMFICLLKCKQCIGSYFVGLTLIHCDCSFNANIFGDFLQSNQQLFYAQIAIFTGGVCRKLTRSYKFFQVQNQQEFEVFISFLFLILCPSYISLQYQLVYQQMFLSGQVSQTSISLKECLLQHLVRYYKNQSGQVVLIHTRGVAFVLIAITFTFKFDIWNGVCLVIRNAFQHHQLFSISQFVTLYYIQNSRTMSREFFQSYARTSDFQYKCPTLFSQQQLAYFFQVCNVQIV